MKKINVLLLGAHINSTNLGCQALTYSLVNMLEKISLTNKISMKYYVFEYQPKLDKTKVFINTIGLKDNQLNSYEFPFINTLKDRIRCFAAINQFEKILKQIDVAIDITAGDSFSDIYGDKRFLATTKIKEVVENKGIPLILAPQTYGPFIKKDNEYYAAKVIRNAYGVITRDAFSADYVKEIADLEIPVTTDLAFQLPYKEHKKETDKINVGLNISGLLVENTHEKGFVNKHNLMANYDRYIDLLLKKITSEDKYNVYLIPHVEEDYLACEYYNRRYASTNLVRTFKNPMDVKSFISGMDIFIGARMHATIGAFTSGVVTIPTAYSRKFETMYSVVEYDVIVDLQKLTTEDALEKTLNYIVNYKDIKKKVEKSRILTEVYKRKTEKFFCEMLLSLGNNYE